MRILIDGRYIHDHYPGIGRYLFNLLRVLPAVAPEHEFLVLHHPGLRNTRYDLTTLERAGLRLVPFPVPPRSLREQVLLSRAARRLAVDLFHAPYYVTAYRMPVPTAVTVYDLIPARYPEYLPSRAARLAFALTMRLALRAATVILTLSEASRRDLVALYRVPSERVVVTPLAPDPRFQPAPPAAVAALRARLGLPERYVLYVGINKPHKNLVRLVEAWSAVSRQQSAVSSQRSAASHQLVVAGYWDRRYPEAQERARELGLEGRVHFLGPVAEEELPALYSGAELFVFPSLYEGFGLPVIEAMACGVPVICANTSSLPEVVGDAALLVEPTDVEAWAAALERALGDAALRQTLRERGRQRAMAFSWERTARLTVEGYRLARLKPRAKAPG